MSNWVLILKNNTLSNDAYGHASDVLEVSFCMPSYILWYDRETFSLAASKILNTYAYFSACINSDLEKFEASKSIKITKNNDLYLLEYGCEKIRISELMCPISKHGSLEDIIFISLVVAIAICLICTVFLIDLGYPRILPFTLTVIALVLMLPTILLLERKTYSHISLITINGRTNEVLKFARLLNEELHLEFIRVGKMMLSDITINKT